MRLTMCGIVAAVAKSNIVPILIEGLNKLEYLGYNSARTALQIGKDRPIQEGTLTAAPTHLANPEPLR